MRKFTVRNEGKWLHQNGAVELDCFEGTLIDNHLYQCKRGYCAVYERPLNCWSSEHVFEFVPFSDGEGCIDLVERFYEREYERSLANWLNELAEKRRTA